MARTVKEEEYAIRRNQILDVAQGLIYTKGYEQMTIQDVLDGVQMSKGAFYHYFDSKRALLSDLERIRGQAAVGARAHARSPGTVGARHGLLRQHRGARARRTARLGAADGCRSDEAMGRRAPGRARPGRGLRRRITCERNLNMALYLR